MQPRSIVLRLRGSCMLHTEDVYRYSVSSMRRCRVSASADQSTRPFTCFSKGDGAYQSHMWSNGVGWHIFIGRFKGVVLVCDGVCSSGHGHGGG